MTSSNPIASGAATGLGIGPTRITPSSASRRRTSRASARARSRRDRRRRQEQLRDAGGEFGTVTGRVRRCGWLDLVALRYAVRLNGMTSLALTKLDVLSIFDELPVCVAYDLPDGSRTDRVPAHQTDFHHATPVFETLAGLGRLLDDVETIAELPDEARSYIAFVEERARRPRLADRDGAVAGADPQLRAARSARG